MKKLSVTLFLIVALIIPVFAENDKFFEFIPKIGYVLSPELTPQEGPSVSAGSLLSLGADLFFDTKTNLFFGIGGMWGQDTTIKHSNTDLGFINLYGQAKYKFLINISKRESFFVYPLLQLGVGFPSWNVPYSDYNKEITFVSGFYWGTGIGVEYRNIVIEYIYGCNYSKHRYKEITIEETPFSYTAFRINVGYKFEF